ncbi:MAG: ATP-binding protein [Mizugakiibacter sp.]|uniref:sensor histidine kinase n=1 Tax=Mizugakiibacter sp. TaxID=1972610 RepID=UPI0031C3FEE9|nr:HAMP domain-containing protein [Xanthomonadaceae bacterium]
MRPTSLEGKLALLLALVALVAAALAAYIARAFDSTSAGVLFAIALLALPLLWVARLGALPVTALLRALAGSVSAFRDGDFSISLHNERRDELGDLVAAHNELGRVLREERQHLFQRELLLDTIVQHTPTALLLVEPGGRIVYANVAARQLLNDGRALAGERFEAVVAAGPPALAQALARESDSLFTVAIDGEDETFHVTQREFKLQGRRHRLVLLRRLTRELARQEVATWKKVIRVISHELNNSLAPIRSLAHSGRELARKGELARLTTAFDTIEERTRHLEGFIQGYARFARLPQPRIEAVAWRDLLDGLGHHYPFRLVGDLPQPPLRADRAQLEQVLINLLKNAHEAGGPADAVEMAVLDHGQDWRIEVRDRGAGMSETVLAHALLPFYSTKRSGSGLGLALAREIAEAHGGRIALANREGGGLRVALSLPKHPHA